MKVLRNDHFVSRKAVYGFGLSRYVVLLGFLAGGLTIFLYPAKSVSQSSTLPLSSPISPARAQALLMYQRLGGINIPVDSSILTTMENQINAGDMTGAANTVINSEPNFYDITVREMAAIMSVRAEVPNAPTSDMVADIIGVVRDNLNAQQLLTGNFIYTADPTKLPSSLQANLPNDMLKDVVESQDHYAYLDANNVDLGGVLINSGTQQLVTSGGTLATNPDPAGVLTSYAFMEAHAIAGTQRRLINYAFREFECIDIIDFAENGPDSMIGRDVDRFPGGDNTVFQTKCKYCHNRLDSMRPAFARFDFNAGNNFISNSLFKPGSPSFDSKGIALKYNQNANVFPAGYPVTNTAWTNTAIDATSQNYFGWSGNVSGASANEFGAMLANSQRFPRCMAQRVFQAVCKRAPTPSESSVINALGDNFAAGGYQFKPLFAAVAALPECLGQQ